MRMIQINNIMLMVGLGILCAVIIYSILALIDITNPRYIYEYYIPISATIIFFLVFSIMLEFDHSADVREISEIVVLVSLISAARIPFAPLPSIQPCTVMIMAVGYVYGTKRGAVIGAFVPLISNFFLGHGPWTLWQMGAWALSGAIGGLIAKGASTYSRYMLFKFALTSFFIGYLYGLIVDISSAIFYKEYYIAVIASFPFDTAHAIGNVVFSIILGPFFIYHFKRLKQRHKVIFID